MNVSSSAQNQDHFIVQQLLESHRQIAFQFKVPLRLPTIVISELASAWGRWDPFKRIIELNRKLIFEHSWDVVLYVLKHEMAHQMVSEIYLQDDTPHGEFFKKACEQLKVPKEFQKGSGALTDPSAAWKAQGQKSETLMAVVQKIEKLFALAKSTNEAEAAVAVAKAQELLRKYDIDQNLLAEQKQDFRYTLYDTGKQRLSPVYSHMASLLMNHYNVDIIFIHHFNVHTKKTTQVLEICGRESHVLIAEYVFDFLMRSLNHLWQDYSKATRAPPQAKTSFQLGVLAGFQKKLVETQEDAIVSDQEASKLSANGNLLDHKALTLNRALLQRKEQRERNHFIKQRHPRLRSRKRGVSQLDSEVYSTGFREGSDIRIHQGITSSKKRFGLLLS